MLGFVFNVADLAITLRHFECLTLGLVNSVNQRLNLGGRSASSNLNLRKWHDTLKQ